MTDKDEAVDEKKGEKDKKNLTIVPIARVKRIAKSDPDLKSISSEALFLIAKATELFVESFAKHSYENTSKDKRKVIQYKDLAKAVKERDQYEFLSDIIPEQVPASIAKAAQTS